MGWFGWIRWIVWIVWINRIDRIKRIVMIVNTKFTLLSRQRCLCVSAAGRLSGR